MAISQSSADFELPVHAPPSADAEQRQGNAEQPAPRSDLRFLVLFAALSSSMGLSAGMAQITTSLYAVQLGASEAMLGLIASAQSVGVLVVGLPAGMAVDRVGPARPFVLGTVSAGLLYFVLPFFPSASWLLITTACVSFFMPLRFVSLNSVFLKALAGLGAARAGWFRATHMLGMFLIGPVVAARVVGAFGHAVAYWCISATFGLTLLLSPLVFGPHSVRVHGAPRQTTVLRRLFADAGIRRVALLEAGSQGINAYYTFFIVVIAVKIANLSAAQASNLVAIKGVSLIAALVLLGRTVTRWGKQRAYLIGLTVGGVSLLVLGLTATPISLYVGGFGLGLGLGLLQIVNLTEFARAGARFGHGALSGVNALVGPSGSFLGGVLGGVVGRALGLPAVFLLGAGACAGAGWLLRRNA